MTDQKRIILGKIATAHGIRGWVKITMYGEDPASFDSYGPLYTAEKDGRTIDIKIKGSTGKHLLAEIKGVTDRNAAEELRGTELWIGREQLPEPEDGQYYYEDLTGLSVEDEDGKAVGTVESVQNYGASDLLEIRPASGGETFFVPFSSDFVPVIDIEGNRIVVTYVEDGAEQ